MSLLHPLETDAWEARFPAAAQADALSSLERGRVLFFPHLAFVLGAEEKRFLSPRWSDGKAKNISLEGEMMRGAVGQAQDLDALHAMIGRLAHQAQQLVQALLPRYAPHLMRGRTRYRPCEVAGRASSYKKDDTRLHVDAFPSRPTSGQRILRVFSNINPAGQPRVWRLGEPFEDLARRYLAGIGPPFPGSPWLMDVLSITKGRRTRYDHLMLALHDHMKKDMDYQRSAPQETVALPPASTWIVFTDQVLHAAMSGQFLLEQTFYLPMTALEDPQAAPLGILERLSGRRLAAG
ncbi:MAG: Kdo hydroxylase family protein [Betaproteobacteria bacterium]|nr:Kdo hydroxylase family protein [Betaproteobacteria bacterium]